MPLDHTPTPTPGGNWDFHPVFPTVEEGEAATLAPKRARSIPEERIDPRLIDLLDFLDWIHDTPAMREFAQPINSLLNTVRSQIGILRNLPRCDKVYQRWLSHLASNFGFKLIDMPFADTIERRRLVCEIVPLLQRRGTLWAVERICNLLGFSCLFDLDFKVNGRWNRSRFFSPRTSASSILMFDWDDGTLQGWEDGSGIWGVISQRLHVNTAGWGTYDTLSLGAFIPEDSTDYCCKFCYEIAGSGDCRTGFVINAGSNDLSGLVLELYKSGATEKLRLRSWIGPHVWFTIAEADISGLDWRTGVHKFVIWDQQGQLTVAIDQTTLFYEQSTGAQTDRAKKGLWAAGENEVFFDNFELYVVDRRKQAMFFHGEFEKTFTIVLGGAPSHEVAKREYLAKTIPEWVPYDIAIVWA